MDIDRELAITLLTYCDQNPDFYFPFLVVCKEYSPEDTDFVEIATDEWQTILDDTTYRTFQLWENLQDLRESTAILLTKGFIEQITRDSVTSKIRKLINEYKQYLELNPDTDLSTEEYGTFEFISGKCEGYEEALYIIEKGLN